MKSQVTFSQFVDGFNCRPDNFTYTGLRALYDAFEEIEEDIGNEITFDPIGICCDRGMGIQRSSRRVLM